MQKKLIYLLFFYSWMNQSVSYAQLPDGVAATQSFITKIITNFAEENSIQFSLQSDYTAINIPINVNLVSGITGSAGLLYSDIDNSLKLTNTYFKSIGIQFYIEKFQIIEDYNYSFISYNANRSAMLARYAQSNRINLFLVDSIKLGKYRAYGFTYFPNEPDSNVIYLCKSYCTGNSLATMLGHFMGLLSTHESGGGVELVSEKNCAGSGDFICDSYADPDLLGLVTDSCFYTGSKKDAAGNFYVPSVSNLMSNSRDHCKCSFTFLQYRRMYYYFSKYRQYLN